MLRIHDYRCMNCSKIFEKLVKKNEKYVMCPVCGETAEKIMSAPMIANYRSGFKKKPVLLASDDRELDLKNEDIMGRRFDELPDKDNIEHRALKKLDELQAKTGRDPTYEERAKIVNEELKKSPLPKEEK